MSAQECRWRVVLEYDGSRFAGWQSQPGQRTIQGAVEQAAAALLQHPVRVTASGRTDAGVHALGQVASFLSPVPRSARAVVGGLNAGLPTDVACVFAEPVPLHFDPRRHAVGKTYRYRWLVRSARSPLRQREVWHLRRPLDAEAMDRAGQALVGRKDFSALRAAGCSASHPVRELRSLRVQRVRDEVQLEVSGSAFLRYMVRNIAGSLTEVGLGRRPEGWIAEVLASRDRRRAGRTAPARGLCLLRVRYPARLEGSPTGAVGG